jgi:hypothetical protein
MSVVESWWLESPVHLCRSPSRRNEGSSSERAVLIHTIAITLACGAEV